MCLKESDRRLIKYLLLSFGVIFVAVAIIGSLVLINYEPQLTNQVNATSIALITAASVGIKDPDFHTSESQNIAIVLKNRSWHVCKNCSWSQSVDDFKKELLTI